MSLFDFFNFFSLVHNEKKQADAVLCGRSMIEMLGVLAIIGMLSVGAMSGYSKAMFKYKLNRQAEALSLLINNAMQLHPPLAQEGSESNIYSELLSKLNLLPDGIVLDSTDTKFLTDMFDNHVWFFAHSATYGIGYEFGKHGNRKEICRNLVNIYKAYADELQRIATDRHYISEDSGQSEVANSDTYYGNNYCTGNLKCIKNITFDDIDILCHQCNKSSTGCRFYINWLN